MGIAFDNSGGASNSPVTSLSYSQTISGSNRAILVSVLFASASGGVIVSGFNVGGVFDSGSGSVSYAHGGNTWTNSLYLVVNPPTGSQSINITFSGTVFVSSWSASYTGVDQSGSGTVDNAGTDKVPTATQSTFGVTATVAGSTTCWAIASIENHTAGMSATSGVFRSGSPGGDGIFDSNGNVSGSASLAASTSGVNVPWSGVWFTIKEAVTATAPSYYGYPKGYYRRKLVGWRKSLGGILIPPQVSLA